MPAAKTLLRSGCLALACAWTLHATAQTGDAVVQQAREALGKNDTLQLAALREIALAERHPLAQWVDYWDLSSRLADVQQSDLDAFYKRWPGTYVEDRLRNDWLLELGKRRDWANFRVEYPRFRLNDDREVICYALLTRFLDGENVRHDAIDAWIAQRDRDDGCQLLASSLAGAGRLPAEDIWRKVRQAVDANRLRAARAAAALLDDATAQAVADALAKPARFLTLKASGAGAAKSELATIALLRIASSDPELAAVQLGTWQRRLPKPLAAYAWASTGREAAVKLLPQAATYYQNAWQLLPHTPVNPAPWSASTIAWGARAALRAPLPDAQRWPLVRRAIGVMDDDDRNDPTWVYWQARARQSMAPAGPVGDPERAEARRALETIAGKMGFYGELATEDLGRPLALPPTPRPLTDAERAGVRAIGGLQRALQLVALGLRNEGVREWNFTIRDLVGDRQLLAAADWACERAVWDRCINTSERTRAEIDMAQRFPMPHRKEIVAESRAIGLDPAYVFGLIRQESRFITDARSGVGASGLMQLMPATARWTARKIGVDYSHALIADPDINIKLGTAYLKLALDDFQGSQALAAAAYNAGPNRSRRWRESATLESAIWAENIPFNETRDYVKKVLSNATWYETLIHGKAGSLKSRLGDVIGPKPAEAPQDNRDLP